MNFPISFTKMSGTGNDFIIIDHREPFLDRQHLADIAKFICRRKFSVGADGLILIESSEQADFSWTFLNADGSLAEMCGNGARCAARFAFEKKIAPAHMHFETLAGKIEAEVIGDSVKIRMTPPTNLFIEKELSINDGPLTVHHLNTGVPHCIHFVTQNGDTPVVDWGRQLRQHPHFQPAGANVNFVEVQSASRLHVRTYERGVEDETLACGTGAVASAIMAAIFGYVTSPVDITTSGGEMLRIHFTLSTKHSYPSQYSVKDISDVFLEGPAHIIYEGQLHSDAI